MRVMMVALIVSASVMWLQTASRQARADEPKKDETQTELKKLQGLWHTLPGGIAHQGGSQVVRLPAADGPCFFIIDDRLLWLDEEGKPTGKEEAIHLDVKADPKRITLTPVGGEEAKMPSHGIYSATDSSLTIHLGLDGGPAPKQFLEFDQPIKGVDGSEWLVSRKSLQGK